ncbi:hypothetical protein ADK76_35960 [Streptomyces griseoflavus]|uniref:hypothetical protein n=1 Tax=Streptomyces rimosus TaxID=1927 RepID=UPI000517FA1F|nr:hypothetical protein [Streptomyces rimosus]KOG51443.1 hypothetical protein ADK76_35960 [Streptomyces griseoflavus]KWT62992.1 hypothetical protein ADL21_04965 [Streptomyces albus subsp. albus]
MPRPTAAQLAYGSATVIFSTLAMLLLSQTRNGAGIAVIAVAALALGLLVAMTAPLPGAFHVARRTARRADAGAQLPSSAGTATARLPRQRTHAGVSSEARVSEHSR